MAKYLDETNMILVFALGNTFFYLLMARGLQGIASTVITVSGKNIKVP